MNPNLALFIVLCLGLAGFIAALFRMDRRARRVTLSDAAEQTETDDQRQVGRSE